MSSAHVIRKAFFLVSAILLTAFLFTACGEKAGSDDSGEKESKRSAGEDDSKEGVVRPRGNTIDYGKEAGGEELLKGRAAFNIEKYDEAVMYFSVSSEKGNAEAMYWLGKCFLDGIGVNHDAAKAVSHFRKAAEQGHAEAQFALGECLMEGDDIGDFAEAVKWYRKAAEQGHAEAQFALGICFLGGRGVQKDHVEGMKWVRMAAENGKAEAQGTLGSLYFHGNDEFGIQRNYAEAVKWYRKAAERNYPGARKRLNTAELFVSAHKGLPEAQYALGRIYETGDSEVKKDIAEAVKWYRKAAEQGHAEARRRMEEEKERARLEELNRDTELTLAVDAIEAFAEDSPTKKAELLKMCEDFIAKDYQPGKPKEELAMARFEADFLKADEAVIAGAREVERHALRRNIEDRTYEARKKREQAIRDALERERRDREQAEEAEEDRLNRLRKATELSDRLYTEKERYAGRMVALTKIGMIDRAEAEYADWLKLIETYLRHPDQTISEVAAPHRDWAKTVLDNIASAKEIHENTYNGNTILADTQIGYGPSGICKVKTISDGKVNAVQINNKPIQFNFDDLPLKQRLVLLRKGAGEAGLSDALYFYLLLYGEFDGAKEFASDDEDAMKICRYVITSYFKYEIGKADEKELAELKKKYGKMPEFDDAMSALDR